ncbi:hypothetical protein N7454_001031 [Penicillium verhagenii]|nr:hypothetical protein N7454_001031 [Penicillium verhagenii]
MLAPDAVNIKHTPAGNLPPPFFITPPSTRKRKAAEAAIADDNQPLPKSATKAANNRDATASDRPGTGTSNTDKNRSPIPVTSESPEPDKSGTGPVCQKKKGDRDPRDNHGQHGFRR